jgi:hypothetical protein
MGMFLSVATAVRLGEHNISVVQKSRFTHRFLDNEKSIG